MVHSHQASAFAAVIVSFDVRRHFLHHKNQGGAMV